MNAQILNTFTPNASCTKHEKTAIRAAIQLQSAVCAAHDFGATMDAGFDAGEWSGPAHADACQRECEQVIAMVAERFDIESWRLGEWVMIWEYEEADRWMDAVMGRDQPGRAIAGAAAQGSGLRRS